MYIPAVPSNQSKTIHIFKQRIMSREILDHAMMYLSEEEQHKANSFVSDSDRRRFVTGRFMLRHFLSEKLGVGLAEVALLTSSYGKPCINHDPPVFFNLSHSGDWVLLASSFVNEIGVDVQIRHSRMRIRSMTKDFTTYQERRYLAQFAPERQDTILHLLWAGKEAALKALGCGLTRDPARVTFAGPLATDEWTHVKGETIIVRALPLDVGHVAAVALLRRPTIEMPYITYKQLEMERCSLISM